MTIDEIQDALRFDMDMMLFDANTGEIHPKENLKYGNEMNYIHYCANEEAIELLEELKELRKMREDIESNANVIKNKGYNKAIDEFAERIKQGDVIEYMGSYVSYEAIADERRVRMTEKEIKEYVTEIRHKADIFRKSGFATTGLATHFDKSADIIEELLLVVRDCQKQVKEFCSAQKIL